MTKGGVGMSLELVEYEERARNAIRKFWTSRTRAQRKQEQVGRPDQGERSGVTAGKNMDGFIALAAHVVRANGLADADIHLKRSVVTLPGYFRPTKQWDLLVVHRGRLVAALEFKSHVGPSFGNNFNNRAEEAIGTAHDFWTAYREGAFGEYTRLSWAGWYSSRTPRRLGDPYAIRHSISHCLRILLVPPMLIVTTFCAANWYKRASMRWPQFSCRLGQRPRTVSTPNSAS